MFFRLSTLELWLIIAAVILAFVALGYLAGRVLRIQAATLREPMGIVQGAFFALVGLILAFGLSLAIGRYDARRAAVADDANTIGTTYLRAQTLAEPVVIFDLDRPTRGLIRVPDAPLVALRASMTLPPAARGPSG